MRIVAVDDEQIALDSIRMKLSANPRVTEVTPFTNPEDALTYLSGHEADVAFLDINMRRMNGLVLAKKIKELYPTIFIVFLTGYSEYAHAAFRIHAAGYLMKPASAGDIEDVLQYIENPPPPPVSDKRIRIQTFGNFDVFCDEKPVQFLRSRSKEILAYLVDKQGTSVTMPELADILWEDGIYDRSRQKQLQVYVSDLCKSLANYGAENILIRSRKTIMLDKSKVSCDLYRFLDGDPAAINSYTGQYMYAYSWAEFTIGYLETQKKKHL